MPRHTKPARLWFREDRAAWCIVHKGRTISTGLGREDVEAAQERLRDYLGERHERRWSSSDPWQVSVADVLAAYAEEVAQGTASQRTIGYHMIPLLEMWGDDMCAAIGPQSCRDYLASRTRQRMPHIGRQVAPATAARELTTLRAALRHAERNDRLRGAGHVPVLAKSQSRERWLTRPEAALALLGILGWEKGADGRLTRRHRPNYYLARFMLIALYTLSRHEVAASVRWLRSPHFPSINVDTGLMHRIGGTEIETRKRKGMLKIPDRLWAHARRWRRLTAEGPVEFRGRVLSTVGDGFAVAMARVGLHDVTPHILKHTGVTWMMQGMRGPQTRVPIEMIADYASTTVRTLLDTYGHHQPDYQERARAGWR